MHCSNTIMNQLFIDPFQNKQLMTLERLLGLNVDAPNIQRDLMPEKIDEIVACQKEILAKSGSFCFIGDLILAVQGRKHFILDGQHRYEAIRRLYVLQPQYTVCVNTFTPTPTFTIEDAFVMLNKHTPVPDYIIKTTVDSTRRAMIDEFIECFSRDFKPYISKAAQPQRPNINLTLLADRMISSAIFDIFETGKVIFSYLVYVNVNKWRLMIDSKTNEKCRGKSDGVHILYMCADKDCEWLERRDWMEEYAALYKMPVKPGYAKQQAPLLVDPVEQRPLKRQRKALPKSTRLIVWENEFGKDTTGRAPCPLCNEEMTFHSFECGHIVSDANGGSSMSHNLRPICGTCNKGMGAMNMNEYCTTYGYTMPTGLGCAMPTGLGNAV